MSLDEIAYNLLILIEKIKMCYLWVLMIVEIVPNTQEVVIIL